MAPHVPSFDLADRVAVVTGAASGIGRAIALGLAGLGASIACIDLPGTELDSTVSAIVAADCEARAYQVDVTDPQGIRGAVVHAEHELGLVTLAANAAGIANSASAADMSPAQWKKLVDVDLTGVFFSCQGEADAMFRSGRGAIVNIASISATIANRGLMQAHYNAAKAGVIQMSRSLAWEWAPHAIRVNTVSPGYTNTPMTLRPEQVDKMEGYARDTPLGRNADPEDIVGAVAFLIGDAASFITGVDLIVDGGYTIW